MRAKKKILLLLTLTLSVLLLCACGNAVHDALYDDDAKIISPEDLHNYNNFSGGGSHENEYSCQFGSFSGKDTLMTISAEEGGALEFSFAVTAERGKLKLLLVSPDGKIGVLQEGTGTGGATWSLDAGEYRFIIMGQSAKGSVAVTLSGLEKCSVMEPE